MNTINFSEGLKIAKFFIENMENPVVDESEYGYTITDGHYTVFFELFGDCYLKENTMLGEIKANLDYHCTTEEYNEFFELPKRVKAYELS